EPPPSEHPLLQFDNVIASPHTAGVTHEARANMGRIAAEQLIMTLDGKRPPRIVNPQVWPAYAEHRTNVRDPAGVDGVRLALLPAADAPEPVVVEPLATHAHLPAARRQWPAADRATFDLGSRPARRLDRFLARRECAGLRGRGTRGRDEHQQARDQ